MQGAQNRTPYALRRTPVFYLLKNGIRTISTIILSALVLLCAAKPSGAQVSVDLRLERTDATLADSLTLVVSVSGVRSLGEPPSVQGLDPFTVSQGGTSSRMEIVNGQVSSGVDYTYYLQPKRVGTFEIGPAEVQIQGGVRRSGTVTIRIREPSTASGRERGSIFVETSLARDQVFVEEQDIYTVKLYLRTKVSDVSLQIPEVEGITFKQLGKPGEYQSVYNGQPYRVLEVRYALVAEREGAYSLPPARMSMTVYEQRGRSPRSPFDDPFFSFAQGRPVTLASEPLHLSVRPLPTTGRPADFTGLVGTFSLKSNLDPPQVKAGESTTLTLTIEGRGNVNRIPDLKGPDLPHAKLYADQPVLTTSEDQAGLSGVKTMKWAIVPDRDGEMVVPAVSVSYFDPAKGKYAVAASSAHTLKVLPGKEADKRVATTLLSAPGEPDKAKQAVKEIGRDILPVHTSAQVLLSGSTDPTVSMGLWALLATPLFLYVAVFVGLTVRRASERSVAAGRARKAARVFDKRCRLGTQDAASLIDGLRDYLNDRLRLTMGSLTPADAHRVLISQGVKEETARLFSEAVQRLENEVYTGKAGQACPLAGDLPGMISRVEKELR
jgi:hypothetical protein